MEDKLQFGYAAEFIDLIVLSKPSPKLYLDIDHRSFMLVNVAINASLADAGNTSAVHLKYTADNYIDMDRVWKSDNSALMFDDRQHILLPANKTRSYSWNDVADICETTVPGSSPVVYNSPGESFYLKQYLLNIHQDPHLVFTGWQKTAKVSHFLSKISIPSCFRYYLLMVYSTFSLGICVEPGCLYSVFIGRAMLVSRAVAAAMRHTCRHPVYQR